MLKRRLDADRIQPIGGGENRTLVLSKLPINDYMLSASFYSISLAGKHVTLSLHIPYNLKPSSLGIQERDSYQENITTTYSLPVR